MVRSGVTIEWTQGTGSQGDEVGLRLTNTGTGHHFPTYVTPEVVVQLQLLDGERRPLEGGLKELLIARKAELRGGVWVELADTRIPADSSVSLSVPVNGDVRWVRGNVVVRPDAFYRRFFESLLASALRDTSRALLQRAHDVSVRSPFLIFEETVPARR
jgi:hypothetical protein